MVRTGGRETAVLIRASSFSAKIDTDEFREANVHAVARYTLPDRHVRMGSDRAPLHPLVQSAS